MEEIAQSRTRRQGTENGMKKESEKINLGSLISDCRVPEIEHDTVWQERLGKRFPRTP